MFFYAAIALIPLFVIAILAYFFFSGRNSDSSGMSHSQSHNPTQATPKVQRAVGRES